MTRAQPFEVPMGSIPMGWEPFHGFVFEIRGLDTSSVQFASRSLLSGTGVVSFDVRIRICTSRFTVEHSFEIAGYDGLRRFRDDLVDLRHGKTAKVEYYAEGFYLCLGVHRHGLALHEVLVVEGFVSSISDMNVTPWPTSESISELILGREPHQSPSVASIRFAFQSSLNDLPYIDNAITQLNEMVQVLQDLGCEP